MKAILIFILSTLRRFFVFIRKPNLKTYKSLPISQKFATVLILLVLNFIFLNLYLLIISHFFDEPVFLSQRGSIVEKGFWLMLLSVCIIAPLKEEFIFRFPLKYNRNYIYLLFTFISKKIKSDAIDHDYKAKRFYNKHFGFFLYFMTSIFAIFHFINFKYPQNLYFYIPLLVLPQFLGGLIFGFLRIRFGFLWSVFNHALYNFIVFTSLFSALDEGKQHELLTKSDKNKPQTEELSVYDQTKLNSLSEKFNDFDEYIIENDKISLKITKLSKGTVYNSYFVGITPDSTRLSMPVKNSVSMFMGIPINDVLVNIADSMFLNYQLNFKKHQKNSLVTKDLLLFHLVKALSLKFSYDECTRVSWQPVIINKSLFEKKTEGNSKFLLNSRLKNLNDYWSIMFVLPDSKIDVFNPDEEIFKDKTENMKDLAREIKSYGVDLKDVRTMHKLVLVE